MAIFSKKEESKEEKKEAVASAAPALGKIHSDLMGVLVQPRISEKSSKAVSLNKYVFVVGRGANKISIKKAVEGAYKVKVQQVNVVRMSGKNKNFGRTAGRTSDFKKAIVTLRKGDAIQGITETI